MLKQSDGSEDPSEVKLQILGDGAERDNLKAVVQSTGAGVTFHGYLPYDKMAAWLSRSDITVNSLVEKAAQSIVTKIGDYLAAGKPMVNTSMSAEFRAKVESDGFGVNVRPGSPTSLPLRLPPLSKTNGTASRWGRPLVKSQRSSLIARIRI